MVMLVDALLFTVIAFLAVVGHAVEQTPASIFMLQMRASVFSGPDSPTCLPPKEWISEDALRSAYAEDEIINMFQRGILESRPHPKRNQTTEYLVRDEAKEKLWMTQDQVYTLFNKTEIDLMLASHMFATVMNYECEQRTHFFKLKEATMSEEELRAKFDAATVDKLVERGVAVTSTARDGQWITDVKQPANNSDVLNSTKPEVDAENYTVTVLSRPDMERALEVWKAHRNKSQHADSFRQQRHNIKDGKHRRKRRAKKARRARKLRKLKKLMNANKSIEAVAGRAKRMRKAQQKAVRNSEVAKAQADQKISMLAKAKAHVWKAKLAIKSQAENETAEAMAEKELAVAEARALAEAAKRRLKRASMLDAPPTKHKVEGEVRGNGTLRGKALGDAATANATKTEKAVGKADSNLTQHDHNETIAKPSVGEQDDSAQHEKGDKATSGHADTFAQVVGQADSSQTLQDDDNFTNASIYRHPAGFVEEAGSAATNGNTIGAAGSGEKADPRKTRQQNEQEDETLTAHVPRSSTRNVESDEDAQKSDIETATNKGLARKMHEKVHDMVGKLVGMFGMFK